MPRSQTEKKELVVSIALDEVPVASYLVVGTMSAGKSTFINSLLGFELFPSKNEACTAKVVTYYANPTIDYFFTFDQAKQMTYIRKHVEPDQLARWNEDDEVKTIVMEGPIHTYRGIGFCILDTPGPNNSMDKNHEAVMKRAIKQGNYEKVFYLLNASQLGTDDDQYLLKIIKKYAGEKEIIFVVNKADVIDDTEEENLSLVAKNVEKYVQQNGFQNPKIYFVSSLAALLAMKVAHGVKLTRKERVAYRRLTILLDRKLSVYNINVDRKQSRATTVVQIENNLWEHSGIPDIIHIL